jgi:hypothetical protein
MSRVLQEKETQMRPKILFVLVSCLALYGCGSDPSRPPVPEQRSANQSEQANIYVKIRSLTAQGDIQGASRLTDDPAAYVTNMEIVKQAMDETSFATKMQEAADKPKIEALRIAGPYSMLVVKFDRQGTLERAVTFFRQTRDGYKEIIDPDESIPCKLVRDFYEIKGEKNGEVKNCAEDKPATNNPAE